MSRPTFGGQARREAALAALLPELFTVQELSRLIVLEFGDKVHASVAWQGSLETIACDVVCRLNQRGRVPQLLDALPRERPYKQADIDVVAAQWPAPEERAATQEEGRRVARGRWAAVLLSMATAGAVASVWPGGPHEPAKNVRPLEPPPVSATTAAEAPVTAPATADTPTDRPASKSYGDRSDCCRVCGPTSKACRNTCIPRARVCHYGPGCACS